MKLMDAAQYSQITASVKRSKGVIQISAGGPGSGRHASGSIAPAKYHQAMVGMGFTHKGTVQDTNGAHYAHYAHKSGVSAYVDRDGNHVTGMTKDGPPNANDMTDKGVGALKENVKSLM